MSFVSSRSTAPALRLNVYYPFIVLPKYKRISMINITEIEKIAESLSSRIDDLRAFRQFSDTRVLRTKKHGSRSYIYIREPRSKGRKEYYIPASEYKNYKRLAQKCYADRLLPLLEKDLTAINDLILNYSWKNEMQLASVISTDLIKLCGKGFDSRETFIRSWCDQTWSEHPLRGGSPNIPANNGVLVRSKSEVFIADALSNYGLNFAYEKPLYTNNSRHLSFPDFTILHPKTLREVYWEHFGKMDDPSYADRNCWKLMDHIRHGLYPGPNFICTFETLSNPLSSTDADRIVRHFFCE